MIKPINRDQFSLQQLSIPATRNDRNLAIDLTNTLLAHKAECVGMAANMIGVYKNVIALFVGSVPIVMFNPIITVKNKPYQASEKCLSLDGKRQATRYHNITVSYQDANFRRHRETFSGFVVQVIQHEIDHCHGKLI